MDWFVNLEREDQEFVKQLVIASGSLKQLAKIYQVSYPTVRMRLNTIIQKINFIEDNGANTFETKVMKLVIDEKLSLEVAKQIITDFRRNNMSDFKGILLGMLVVAVLYMLDRYLPRWFGAIPGAGFLGFIIYIVFTKEVSLLSIVTVLLVGEAVLNGIWIDALVNRRRKMKKEVATMKAKDLLRK